MRKVVLLMLTIIGGILLPLQVHAAPEWTTPQVRQQSLTNHFKNMTVIFYADNRDAHINVKATHQLPMRYRIEVGANNYQCRIKKDHHVSDGKSTSVGLVINDQQRGRQVYLSRAGTFYNRRHPQLDLMIPLRKLNRSLSQSAIMKLTVLGKNPHVITTVGLSTTPFILVLFAAAFAGLGLFLGRNNHHA